MKPKYETEVTTALACLNEARVVTGGTVSVQHPKVKEAHQHLKRACRLHRRQRAVAWFWFSLEENAVAMGYLRFDQVDKP